KGAYFRVVPRDHRWEVPRLVARGPVADPSGHVFGRHGPAQVEALGHVAVEAGQQVPGDGRLDPFRHHPQGEFVPQVDGGPNDHRVTLDLVHVRDERPVDLDLVDGQALERGTLRVPGPEVVHRQ